MTPHSLYSVHHLTRAICGSGSVVLSSLSNFKFHSAGETTYNLDTAGGLRMEVQKYYELIDALRYIPFTEYVLTNFKSLWIKVC